MSSPINGSTGPTTKWAEVVYTAKTDTVSLPDSASTPAPPQKWSDEVKLPGDGAPKASVESWAEDYKVVMPDPWKDRVPQGIPWMEMGEVFKAPPPRRSDPLALDLNNDGKIGVTGQSTAKDAKVDTLGRTVSFDIDGDGKKDEIEWMSGDGDGMLVDDRDGGATGAMLTDGEINGTRLFGDEGGKFANGFEKLKAFDKDGDGKLTGKELEGLKVWIDDGDAKLEGGELKSLAELGITEMSVQMQHEKNARGETLERSSYVQNGETRMSEDVWFGKK